MVADHGTWEERDYPATRWDSDQLWWREKLFSWNNSELANESISCRWVSTDAHDIVVHEGTEWRSAFFRLFNYIDGTNSENSKIPMTKPVSVRYLVERGHQMKLRQHSFSWTSGSQPDSMYPRQDTAWWRPKLWQQLHNVFPCSPWASGQICDQLMGTKIFRILEVYGPSWPTSSWRTYGPALGPSGLLDIFHALWALKPCDPHWGPPCQLPC